MGFFRSRSLEYTSPALSERSRHRHAHTSLPAGPGAALPCPAPPALPGAVAASPGRPQQGGEAASARRSAAAGYLPLSSTRSARKSTYLPAEAARVPAQRLLLALYLGRFPGAEEAAPTARGGAREAAGSNSPRAPAAAPLGAALGGDRARSAQRHPPRPSPPRPPYGARCPRVT